MTQVSATEEQEVIVRALLAAGAPRWAAELQARWLVEADLRGQSSHGIRRLPVLVERMRRGLVAAGARGRASWCSPAVLQVDGERGFGPVVGLETIGHAREAAAKEGIALALVSNANHLGILAPYVEELAAEDCVGIALTTSEALVHPWGGRSARMGTNPIAIAIPAQPEPLVLDMATGEVSMGKILHALETGQALEPGWAVDDAGEPTIDPAAAVRGAITPFGGPKGYALGLTLGVLVAALTGSALGTEVRGTLDADEICNKGDVFVCIDLRVLRRADQVEPVSRYLAGVRETPPRRASEPVRIPGDRARAERRRRLGAGVEIADASWEAARGLAGAWS